MDQVPKQSLMLRDFREIFCAMLADKFRTSLNPPRGFYINSIKKALVKYLANQKI